MQHFQTDLLQVWKNGRKFCHLIGIGATTAVNLFQQRARPGDLGKDLSRECSVDLGKAKVLEGCKLRTLENLEEATHASKSLLGLLEI